MNTPPTPPIPPIPPTPPSTPTTPARRRKPAKPRRLFTIKVTLNNVRPPIWRRIVVRSNATLGDLHLIIQVAMGWTMSHLHKFEIGGIGYSESSPHDPAHLLELGCGSSVVGLRETLSMSS